MRHPGNEQPSLCDAERRLVSAITGSEADALDAEQFVLPGPRMPARACLNVYRSAYRSRLIECLQDDFPVLAKVLGKDRFDAIALRYIEEHPSASPNLNGFGRLVASFCREGGHDILGNQSAFASELAALEWAVVEVIHAEASGSLDAAALQSSSPERWATARFARSEAVRLLRFEYPVNGYYQAALELDDVGVHPSPSPSATLVYRKDVKVWRMDLTPAMARILSPILSGEPIGSALEAIASSVAKPEELAELVQNVGAWFREWAHAGIFGRIEWPEDAAVL